VDKLQCFQFRRYSSSAVAISHLCRYLIRCWASGPGITKVEKGWLEFQEINRVFYDPEKVNIEKMVEWLKDAGTYQKTLTNKMADKGDSS
jgi:hypothetical protein